MSSRRVPLSERRSQERGGIDGLINPVEAEPRPPRAGEPPVRPPRPPERLEKVTLYVRPDQVLAIEEIQLKQRRRTGKKPDKSDLIQEAIDLVIQKYSKEA